MKEKHVKMNVKKKKERERGRYKELVKEGKERKNRTFCTMSQNSLKI